jgi:hypothetical protein
MFNNLTYKKKNKLLLVATVLFAFLVYRLSVSNTLEAYTKCAQLEQQLTLIDEAPEQLAGIEKQLKEFEQILGKDERGNYQEELLELVSNYCASHQLILRDYPNPFLYQEQDFSVETNKITTEGSFIQLVQMAYLIEQKKKLSRIASFELQTFTRNIEGQKKIYLSSTLYLQHIKSNKNEQ